jgi:hypothetical protein
MFPTANWGTMVKTFRFSPCLRYQLEDPALQLLGQIVQATDSHPSEPHTTGEGLRWIAHGFSALGLCDREILEREFIVYDALYAECKRRVLAADK